MLLPLLWFIAAMAILLISADLFINQITALAKKWRISPLIIGTTVVALGTSLPELAVSLTCAVRGHGNMAIHNIVGSNIANVFLIFGLAIVGGRIFTGTDQVQKNNFVMLASGLLLAICVLIGWPRWAGIILLMGAVVVSIGEYYWGTHRRLPVLKKQHHNSQHWLKNVALVALGLLGTAGGGWLAVEAVENLAAATLFSTTFFGLTLTAIATSLPELFVTLLSVHKKENKLAIGNIVGSNIYNALLIGGLVAWFPARITVAPLVWWFYLLATLGLFVIILKYRRRPIGKWVGGLLLFGFLLYAAVITYLG